MFPLLPEFQPSDLVINSSLAPISRALVVITAVEEIQLLTNFISNTPINTQVNVSLPNPSYWLENVNEVIKIFNSGVTLIFSNASLIDALLDIGIPEDRFALKVDQLVAIDYKNISNFFIDSSLISDPNSIPKIDESKNVFVEFFTSAIQQQVNDFASKSLIPIIKSSNITVDLANEPSKISAADVLISTLSTDRPDKLYTSLVVDKYNVSLGLVYSSPKSISEALRTGTGVYQSRKHGLWYKGATSGATQKLLNIEVDCDGDCLKFVVEQTGVGFCHLDRSTCFGSSKGLVRLEQTLQSRLATAPEGSYTKRLFNDERLLAAKIREEADELIEAKTKDEVAWEAADLFYFALTKLVKEGVSLADVSRNLDQKGLKVTRRKGDAKPKYIELQQTKAEASVEVKRELTGDIHLHVIDASTNDVKRSLDRPAQTTNDIMKLVLPIVNGVKERGDKALLEFTAKFDGVNLDSPIIKAPFPKELMELSPEVKESIDISIENVHKFHEAQLSQESLVVETAPGVICSRFARPIDSVGLYIPGGTAVLPSTALMLGVPAKAAGCKEIIFASPPGKNGKLTPEVVYVAHKVGAKAIVLAGGAQAIAALAYGTESIPKVNKIMGPGNQFVTAAKMYVQNDTAALVSIDMPAGPSEVLVICDKESNPDFVASDLLSQAEHGADSQVILLAIDMNDKEIDAIQDAVHNQAIALPRVDIIRKSIAHSSIIRVSTPKEAFDISNEYGPEHLILQLKNASSYVDLVDHAGSVFVGPYSPESCGDYSSGTNHTLPTYGYAKMYSGVNTGTFMKSITSQELTVEGLKSIGKAVMTLAAVEGLDGHRNAVKVRMDHLGLL